VALGVVQDTRASHGQGGICGEISIAHSLVRRLQVVDTMWGGVLTMGHRWDRDFLQAIASAGGATRTMSPDQVDQAHTADWNTDQEIVQTHDRIGAVGVWGMEYEDWANLLARQFSEFNRDCVLYLYRNWASFGGGHMAYIESARWNEETEEVEVLVLNTGKQEADGTATFRQVPFDPGRQTWFISSSGIRAEGGDENFWNSRGYDWAYFSCYGVRDADSRPSGQPGSAMPETDGPNDNPVSLPSSSGEYPVLPSGP